jgi:hypothetical protein
MLSFMKQASRLVDLVALAAVGGTLMGVFMTFLMFAHLLTASEWRHLIGAQRIVSLEHLRGTLTISDDADSEEAGAALAGAPPVSH